MARLNLANWRGPIPNMNTGGIIRPLRGLVLHVQEGTEAGTDATFHDPHLAIPRSAHFGNPQAGRLDQWVDTNDMAWAQVAGNPQWISVENEGVSGATGYSLNEN
ncbi:MAG TPA: N-acetylmuramoyl-L-alanine amidase, partial [Gemmataceae bacterium]|nr:N-acetylmuramoyl-L-alanine amidase [Gemmataceae bacterium]